MIIDPKRRQVFGGEVLRKDLLPLRLYGRVTVKSPDTFSIVVLNTSLT
jgi:hypothetical protein